MYTALKGMHRYVIRKAKVHPWYSIPAHMAFWAGCALGIICSVVMMIKLIFKTGFDNCTIGDIVGMWTLYLAGAIFIVPALMIAFRAIVTIIMKYTHAQSFYWVIKDSDDNICTIIPIYAHYNRNEKTVLDSYLKSYNYEQINKQRKYNSVKYASAIIKYV